MKQQIFKNREQAGQEMAKELQAYKRGLTLILALPRGGIPVGYQIAKSLDAPLDTIVARKLGTPENPEYGFGAIAPGNIVILDNKIIEYLEISQSDITEIIESEKREMMRRMEFFKSGEFQGAANYDTVILVDDGLATGVTARAAAASVKQIMQPKNLIFAAPVCARESVKKLTPEVDEIFCGFTPEEFSAVGQWYHDFSQVSDDESLQYLLYAQREREEKIAHKP